MSGTEGLDTFPRQQGGVPAQDLDAEMSVLGSMLLGGKDTIGEILDCSMAGLPSHCRVEQLPVPFGEDLDVAVGHLDAV